MKTLARSFAGGEITPELYGRVDLVKFQTGLAKALNFWTLPHGPAQNRPGFEYVIEVKDSTKKVRLIAFSFNTQQTYIIEVGEGYIRFHTFGGTLIEDPLDITAITQANPGVFTIAGHGYNTGDWVFLAGVGGMTLLNGRYFKVVKIDADTFSLTDLAGSAIDTSSFSPYTGGGTASRVYEISNSFTEGELADIHYTQSADVLTLVHPNHAPAELRRLGAVNWQLVDISFAPTIEAPGAPTLTTGGPGGGTPVNVSYVTTAVREDTLEESFASVSSTVSIDLTVGGNFVDIDPTPGGATVPGAVRYNIYKLYNGLYGFIGQTNGEPFHDDNFVPDVSQTPPITANPFTGADNFPGAVGYFEGRRVFAGTNNKPQNYWLTRSGTESNLSYSIPTRDDDTIQGRMLASQVNRIRHIVPLSSLILLTSGGEWKIAPQNSDILTPSSAAPKQDSSEGADNVVPVIIGNAVLYVQEGGNRIRELRYRWDQGTSGAFSSNDISIMAPHLFDGFTIVDMAYTKLPNKMVWAVRSDGVLLGLTYLPEHQVLAWHHHATSGGAFESVAAVKEGTEYPLYAVVRRTINGRTVRYIERQHTRFFSSQSMAFFVDSGLSYAGPPVSVLSGLHHLEGETVSILADGAVHPQMTVVDGTVTLENSASVVHIGKQITADLQTLPLAVEVEASGGGTRKNVNEVWFLVTSSGAIKAGPTFDQLHEIPIRTSEPYGTPPSLKTGLLHLDVTPDWTDGGQICIRQQDPLPITISSMVIGFALGG